MRGEDREGRLCSLEDALAYENEAILHKFLESYDLSFAEAEELFMEMKKWLWISRKWSLDSASTSHPLLLQGGFTMDTCLSLLDEMWHTFILFTRDYVEYCQQCYGTYLHHTPTPQAEKDRLEELARSNPREAVALREEALRVKFHFICEHLGEATLEKWYVTYGDRYTPEYLRSILIKHQKAVA